MLIFIGVVIWILCGVLSYIINKASDINGGLGWTVADRRNGVAFSLFGPVALLASIVVYLVYDKSDKPAKW
jgi:hypothetical protein